MPPFLIADDTGALARLQDQNSQSRLESRLSSFRVIALGCHIGSGAQKRENLASEARWACEASGST